MPRFLGILYTATARGEAAVLETVIDQLLGEYESRLPPGDPALFAALAAAVIRNTLSDLTEHGAVAVGGLDHVDDQQAAVIGVAPWALHPQPGMTANLTDLGRYLVRQRLLAENAHAPGSSSTLAARISWWRSASVQDCALKDLSVRV
jgi:hypothetical protein